MAACTELEIVEKSSEESSRNIEVLGDASFFLVNSAVSDTASRNANGGTQPEPQTKVEPETGDLKELSDDEFLHLLKEASTFNKPNNQESILLKQLRKEVSENDVYDNAISETNSASKLANQNCSNVNYSKTYNSTEFPLTCNSIRHEAIPISSLPKRTFKIITENGKDKTDIHMILNSGDELLTHIPPQKSFELQATNNNQWTVKSQSITHHVNSSKYGLETPLKRTEKHDISNSASSYVLNLTSPHNGLLNSANERELMDDSNKSRMDSIPTLLVNHCDNNVADGLSSAENCPTHEQASKNPQEIELIEFKRSKVYEIKEQNGKSNELDDINVCEQLANSRFYVNCREVDVDAPVGFPVKVKRQMNLPCIWPRNQVHSFISSIPVDQDVLQSQNDSDGNSNPFSRGGANITSFVSATLLDYPNSTLISESQASKLEWSHRKHKRTRNHTDNFKIILSENIAGHRGNEDIDSLVKYIEAADANEKHVRGNGANQIVTTKSSSTPDPLKRKLNGRETKHNQNKNGNLSRKKMVLSSDEDSNATNKSDTLSLDNKPATYELESSDDSSNSNRNSKDCTNETQYLDINSNLLDNSLSNFPNSAESSDSSMLLTCSETVDSFPVLELSNFNSNEIYCSSEVVPQTIEESGFCVVKKKQRKKHQGKRSENYRWHSAAARVRQSTSGGDHGYYSKDESQNEGSIMLLSSIPLAQRSPCGKQDSRRKSTSSVPHSEQSSPDNSDLDSVHSLPVRGSAPHITGPHPHTTPSSSSSTPQASYADIARMPVSSSSKGCSPAMVNPIPPPVASAKHPIAVDWPDKSVATDPDCRDILNLITVSDTKPLEAKGKDTCAIVNSMEMVKETREINTQTDLLPSLGESRDTSPEQDSTDTSSRSAANCSPTEIVKSSSPCATNLGKVDPGEKEETSFASVKQDSMEQTDIPAVVMMGNIPTIEMSDISFGIDLNEIMQISSGESALMQNACPIAPNTATSLNIAEHCPSAANKEGNEPPQPMTLMTKCSSDSNCLPSNDSTSDFNLSSKNYSSLCCSELCLSSGQKLLFSDKEVDMKQFNYNQIVDLFSREWKTIQKEFTSDCNQTETRVKYYKNNC